MTSLRSLTRAAGSVTVCRASFSKNSPGRRSVVPYTNSATLHCRSLLTAVRMLSKTSGSVSTQWVDAP